MIQQQPVLPGTHDLHSERSPYRIFSLLLVAAMMVALLSVIYVAGIAPALPARTQTATLPLPTSYVASPLLSKPEIIHLRSSHVSHFDLGNGRRLAVVGPAPLNYQDAAGTWQPIQPAFTPVDGGWRVDHNALRSTFASDSTAVQVESEGQVFGWQPVALEIEDGAGSVDQLAVPATGRAVQAEGLGNLLRYANAWSDATLVEQFQSGAGSLEQELILTKPPAGEGQWLSLRVDLALPPGVQIVANGQVQTGEFATYGAVEFQQAGGAPLLALIPPQAYEQEDRSVTTVGRYRVVPHGEGLSLWVQTPLDWWLAAERSYPAVLDPTMQVLRGMEWATIDYPYDEFYADARVAQQTCVGLNDEDPMVGQWNERSKWYDRGYVKFKLPNLNLPSGSELSKATLVGSPDPSRESYTWPPGGINEYTLVHRVTEDWSFLQSVSTVPKATDIAHAPETDRAQIPYVSHRNFDPSSRPVTTWDVTGDVRIWYADPNTNHGFALVAEHEGEHLDYTPSDNHNFHLHCFPPTPMEDLDNVVENPTNATTGGAGLALLIEYVSPQLAANELRTVLVPSAVPGDVYLGQHHEYDPPNPSGWQIMAARGQRAGKTAQTRLLLTQTVPTDPDLVGLISDAGAAAPANALYLHKPNYIVVNGHQSLPPDLRLQVLHDTFASHLSDDNRDYMLQIADANQSPIMPGFGVSISLPIALGSGFVAGQEINLVESSTVEIKIPFGTLHPQTVNLQLFPPILKYGSREVPGIQITEGPDAWEIEIVVPAGQSGNWLLAAINDGLYPNHITLNAQVVACENSPDVLQYPVNGECVELRPPPMPVPQQDPDHLYVSGDVRIWSPAGFTGNCSTGACTTKAKMGDGTAVAALIGHTEDDNRWVALKGGQFNIQSNVIETTEDVRLIMAEFGTGPLPVTLPVLRGKFRVTDNSQGMVNSISTDTYLMVGAPLPEGDMDNGWSYGLDLSEARMWARGPVQRVVEPTETTGQATFDFDARWSITARGGQDLLGAASLSNNPGSFQVGTLIVQAPLGQNYALEHNPADILPSMPPQSIPDFEHIRVTGATLKQPANLGGAQVPVQALILAPGKSVMDPQEPGLILYCGAAQTCFDLRGEDDAMGPTGPHVVRQFRMPDLIIQDQAGTVMINTPEGVEIYSRDHPESRLGLNGGDYSFSYEAFGATIRTYQGACPLPRNAMDPTEVLPGTAQVTTVVEGEATLSLPNAESESGGPEIKVGFRLCENSLREMSFSFYTGEQTALPLGNSGLFLNLVGGIISLAPEQGPEPGYTTVVLEVGVRGMSPDSASSNIFVYGVVTIDTRGLFDMQLQAGLKVAGGYGVGVDGHFWVAWAPLDLGFEVQACAPYDEGFDTIDWPLYGHRCQGNELLFGSLRAHLWQGQGWQHKYHWLPDNDDLHVAARYKVSINIAAGMLVDWEFIVIPPEDVELYAITLAFGEFCMNQACTAYEWGVTGAYTLLGFDFGIYYGFDSGLDFILGSGDYLLIDEAGQAISAGPTPEYVGLGASSPYTINIPAGTPSAMFVLGWDPGTGGEEMQLTLADPSGDIIDRNTVDPAVTVALTPTVRGWQIMIILEDPAPGEWHVYATGGDTLPHKFVYFANKPELTLTLSGIPDPAVRSIEPGEVLGLEWESNISDGQTAWFSLYYSVTNPVIDGSQEIGGPIVERLPLTPHGLYEWEVQGLAYVDNWWNVYARIDTNAAAEINDCGPDHEYNPDPTANEAGCGTMLNRGLLLPTALIPNLAEFFYEDKVAPSNPDLAGAQAADWTSVMVLWRPNPEVDLAGYLVSCEQTGLVRTVRVPAEHMADAPQFESALVNGLFPNQTANCSLRAYDTTGNVSGYSESAQVVPEMVIGKAVLSPEQSVVLTSLDGKVVADFPAGMSESKILLELTQRTLPPHPTGVLAYEGTAFSLSAYTPGGRPVTQFAGDFTLTVTYPEPVPGATGGEAVRQYNLYTWDGSAWHPLLPCYTCSHDPVGRRFTLVLNHLTEFAVLSGDAPPIRHVYLPLIVRAK